MLKPDHAVDSNVNSRVFVATRVFLPIVAAESAPPPLPQVETIRAWIRQAAAFGSVLCIAVAADEIRLGGVLIAHIRSILVEDEFSKLTGVGRLYALPVSPWGAFVTAPNVLALAAAEAGCDMILFQSLEVNLSPDDLALLAAELDADTLVVGPALGGHAFASPPAGGSVEVPLDGRTVPWNTCALWATARLNLLGFPLVAEGGPLGPAGGGVEEVTAVAVARRVLGGAQCGAKLVRLPGAGAAWKTEWADPARGERHERKMASKVERPAGQLRALGMAASDAGTVLHIDRSA